MDSPPLLSNMEEGAANMSGGDGVTGGGVGGGGGGGKRVVVAAKGAVEEVNAAVQVRREGHGPCVCYYGLCAVWGVQVYSVYSVSSFGYTLYTHPYSRCE
jgi:hypothetical protein